MYKVGMAIAYNILPTALFYYCSQDPRSDIMRDLQLDVNGRSGSSSCNQEKAVKEENTLVHRLKLNRYDPITWNRH